MSKYKTPEYKAYNNARNRCTCKKAGYYKNYGGRGIRFKFKNFEQFFAEVGKRPSPQHSIERIRNNGHYQKGNVRWATRSEQNRNRRPIPEDTKKRMSAAAKARCTPAWRKAVSKRVREQHRRTRVQMFLSLEL